ncbi:hypothetical protein Y981_08580 [Leptospirillum ferriphilum YSK]|uniref:Uncharacterized protein n=1 Tax=Leptospirillum ferriphilum YSK TaxID=1441628 RepID=A0A059XXK3_9BACT|nr:hypothetical protein Y981_08580 [Leptospirillum ferriphilum YSK]
MSLVLNGVCPVSRSSIVSVPRVFHRHPGSLFAPSLTDILPRTPQDPTSDGPVYSPVSNFSASLAK